MQLDLDIKISFSPDFLLLFGRGFPVTICSNLDLLGYPHILAFHIGCYPRFLDLWSWQLHTGNSYFKWVSLLVCKICAMYLPSRIRFLEYFLIRQFPLRKPLFSKVWLCRDLCTLWIFWKYSLAGVACPSSVFLFPSWVYLSWLQSFFSVFPWTKHFQGHKKVLTVLLVKIHIYLIELGIAKPSSLQQKDSNFAVGEMLVAHV